MRLQQRCRQRQTRLTTCRSVRLQINEPEAPTLVDWLPIIVLNVQCAIQRAHSALPGTSKHRADTFVSATYPTKLLLAFRSGDRCAFPGCPRQLTVDAPTGNDPVVVGEAAHIAGENRTAARYDATMTDDQRNHYDNLIYLCGDHHTQIDKQPAHFTTDALHRLKAEHESKVRDGLNAAFAQIGFPELQFATAWVNRVQPQVEVSDLALLPPEAKIKKNDLHSGSRVTITMGLSVAKLVGEFVQQEALIDPDYPERLRAGFLEEYFRLRREGHRGDVLFDLMCEFSQRGLRGQSQRSAGLAVLVYLFEKCDVFEK